MTGLDIKLCRIIARLKGCELAKLIGITPDRLSKIENGHLAANEEIISRIKQFVDLKKG